MYSDIIKERRIRACMTQGDLAKKLKTKNESFIQVTRWERGLAVPSFRSAKKLAKILGGEPHEYRI